jgi:cation diffusion facilitator CzcD-associated flavoprotein CzcO
MSGQKIAVIGAGPCGLPTCKALARAGLDYECLEAGDQVGGVWNLASERTGAYRSLHTNTSTQAMAYSDFPFEDAAPRHLAAHELQEYFERYATESGVRPHIRFGQRVEHVRPVDGDDAADETNWELEFANGERRRYSALIVATGQYVRPRWPTNPSPENFGGEVLHVFDYFDPVSPVDCRDKRVVVVGLGSSAAEVAAELADPKHPIGTASRVHLAARSGRWVINKVIDGKPVDAMLPHPSKPLPAPLRALPDRAAVWAMRRLMRAGLQRFVTASGSPESLGLPVPSIEPWEERPTMSNEFIPAVREGRIEIHPGIASFEGRQVTFSDGSSVEADVVLYATGYELEFPFLDGETLGCAAPDLALYQQIAHPEHERLFFVGCLRVSCSMWPVAEQQALWIAKLLSGGFEPLAGTARRDAAVPLAGSLPVLCNLYVEALRREAGGL